MKIFTVRKYLSSVVTTGLKISLWLSLLLSQVPHAFVNCVECYSAKLLYGTILCQLTGTDGRARTLVSSVVVLSYDTFLQGALLGPSGVTACPLSFVTSRVLQTRQLLKPST